VGGFVKGDSVTPCTAADEPATSHIGGDAPLAENVVRELHEERYPSLAEMIVEHALKRGYEYAE
jgi:hypothetical protein